MKIEQQKMVKEMKQQAIENVSARHMTTSFSLTYFGHVLIQLSIQINSLMYILP